VGAPVGRPWAIVFPTDPSQLARHPSQLYQAGLEGLALCLLMWVLARREGVRARPGLLTGALIAGYGVARLIGEFFREPDAHLGYLLGGVTMGQLLSLPMVAVGAWLILRRPPSRLMERLDAFMARAAAAYYGRGAGIGADFTTAPEMSQAFGECLGLWCAVTWQAMGAPARVVWAELGPGRGTLMQDAHRAASQMVPAFAAAAELHLVETSPVLRAMQKGRLGARVQGWHDAADTLPQRPAHRAGETSSSMRCRSASSSGAAADGPSASLPMAPSSSSPPI
jgi:hypothetical protein